MTSFTDGQVASNGVIIPVKGEYGSGKTHLLLDAAALVNAEARGSASSIIMISGMEASPVEWYREAIGPALKELPLERLAIELYAKAAEKVAGASALTSPAVEAIRKDARAVRNLVRRDLLSVTAVEAEFSRLVAEICRDATEDVRRVVSYLIWDKRDIAIRWLSGETLSDRERALSSLPTSIDDERSASAVVSAIAAVHQYLRRPLAIFIDELEHFTRHDYAKSQKRNITWLKRLLEQLASHGALVVIAGHWSAWNTERDFLDRFSLGRVIELAAWNADNVLRLVESVTGKSNTMGYDVAEEVARRASGNTRRVIALLHDLFEATDGFVETPSVEDVKRTAAAQLERVDADTALRSLQEIFEESGLSVVRRGSVTAGLVFDMVALLSDGRPLAVVELTQATYHLKQQDQAQRFIDRMRVVRDQTPECIGFFVAEGTLDRSLKEILGERGLGIYWLDLTNSDYLFETREALESAMRAAGTSQVNQGTLEDPKQAAKRRAETDAAMAQVVQEIQELKEANERLFEEMASRVRDGADLERSEDSTRLVPPGPGDYRDETRRVYELVTAKPSITRRVAVLFDSRTTLAAVMLLLGVVVLIFAQSFASVFVSYLIGDYGSSYYERSLSNWTLMLRLLSIVSMVPFTIILARRILDLGIYYDYRDRVLKDLYLREAPPRVLSRTATLFEENLEAFGPRRGRIRTAATLTEEDEAYSPKVY
jgi:hypothetical protein